jgi:hypothetical protein
LHIDHRKYENKREAERRGMLRIEITVRGRKLSLLPRTLIISTRMAASSRPNNYSRF